MMRRTKEETLLAFNRAPKAIQDALSDGPAVDFMVGLQTRYSLHIDVAGSVVERIRDLLLGLSNPTEFLGELIQLGISDTVARTLVGDLNKEVFIPLREKMQNEPKEAAPAKAPEPITVPQQSLGAKSVLPAPTLDYQAPTLPGSPIMAPMPVAAPEPKAVTAAPETHVAYPLPQTAPQQGWHSAAAVHIYVPSHGTPFQAPVAQAPLEERVVDVVESPMQAAAPATPAESVTPPTPPQAPTPPPLTKSYAADPYREPV